MNHWKAVVKEIKENRPVTYQQNSSNKGIGDIWIGEDKRKDPMLLLKVTIDNETKSLYGFFNISKTESKEDKFKPDYYLVETIDEKTEDSNTDTNLIGAAWIEKSQKGNDNLSIVLNNKPYIAVKKNKKDENGASMTIFHHSKY